MANLVKSQVFGGPDKQILIGQDSNYSALGAVIAATGAADVDGKKIIKAGTPVKGDLKDRNTAFVKNTEAPNAIVLHDVDVTNGENNGTIVFVGTVDLNRVDADVEAMITAEVEAALPTVKFVKS